LTMVLVILTLGISGHETLMLQQSLIHQVMVEAIGVAIMQSRAVGFSLPTSLAIIQPIVALVIHHPVPEMIFTQIIMMNIATIHHLQVLHRFRLAVRPAQSRFPFHLQAQVSLQAFQVAQVLKVFQ